MIKYELIKLSASICKALAEANIDPADVNYLRLYEEWLRMKAEGHKYDYILFYLGQQYGISKTTVWRIITRMGENI